jgi:hypothetical protein
MSTTPMGDYWVVSVHGGTRAILSLVCPFCSRTWKETRPTREVMTRPVFITSTCPTCGLSNTYAPKTRP